MFEPWGHPAIHDQMQDRYCDCIDCGGDQPTHSSTCSSMCALVGSDCPPKAADPRHKPNYRLCACDDCVPFYLAWSRRASAFGDQPCNAPTHVTQSPYSSLLQFRTLVF